MPIPRSYAHTDVDLAMVNPADMVEPNIIPYTTAYMKNCISAAEAADIEFGEAVSICAARLRSSNIREVRTRAVAGQTEDRLELGLRCVSSARLGFCNCLTFCIVL